MELKYDLYKIETYDLVPRYPFNMDLVQPFFLELKLILYITKT